MPLYTDSVSVVSDASGDGTATLKKCNGLIHNVYIEPVTGSPGTATWTITTVSGKDILNGAGATGSASARVFSRADMGGTSNGEGALTVTGASMGNTKTWTVYVDVVS